MLLSGSQTHSLLMPAPVCSYLPPPSPQPPSPCKRGESLGRRIPLKKSADLTAKVKTMGDEEKIGDNRVGGEMGRKDRQRWKGGRTLLALTFAGTASLPLLSTPRVFFLFPLLLPSFSFSSARLAVISMQHSASLCSAVWVCLNAHFLAHCCMSDGKGIALQCRLHSLTRMHTHTCTHT